MKILSIAGSPRQNGYSSRLLRAYVQPFLNDGWQTAHFEAADDSVRSCTACQRCHTTGVCCDAGKLTKLYEDLQDCDAVAVASPVYFFGLSAQLKRIIDRCQPFWVRRFKLKDQAFISRPQIPCAYIAVAGGPQGKRTFTAGDIVMEMFCNTMGYTFGPVLHVDNSDAMTAERFAELEEETRAMGVRALKGKEDGTD